MVEHVLFFGYVILAGFVFARLEIHIEGDAGWAAKLPTWRIDNVWTRLLFSGRPLTGYHFWVQLFMLVMVHAPYGLGLAVPTWAAELRMMAFLVLFYLFEDFIWFVMNPAFGLRRFRREHIWWHARNWWWVMPRDYWVFLPLGLLAYIGSIHVAC